MSDEQTSPSDYVLLPSVTHPQGRKRAFDDAFKALVRAMIEVNDNPTFAYAIDKTDRIVTEENMNRLTDADLAEWDAACVEFEAKPAAEQKAWVETVLSSYPPMDDLPDLDGYNHLN